MQTKLTLRLEEKLIRRAKFLAKKTGKSISQIVADCFALLENQPEEHDFPLTPLVSSLKGALRGTKGEIEDYRRYIEEKYL